MRQRVDYIDFLRFIGLSLVILAHTDAPDLVLQLRSFDVPLMVFVSGLSYGGLNLNSSLKNFYLSRTLRILIPVYLFLTLYFLIFHFIRGHSYPESYIINSYLLLENNSIGFVWIFRVFLMIMLVTPILKKIAYGISLIQLFTFLLGILLLQEIVVSAANLFRSLPFLTSLWIETVPYITGYSICFLFGCHVRQVIPKTEIIMLISVFLILLLALIISYLSTYSIIRINVFKYPPRHIYILYGISISSLLWYCRHLHIKLPQSCIFIGRNTLWIYLWHIVILMVTRKLVSNWGAQYIITYLLSISFFRIQYLMVKHLYKIKPFSFHKYFIG